MRPDRCRFGEGVMPDVGGIKRAQIFRELLKRRLGRDIEFASIEKRRTGGAMSSGRVVGAVASQDVVVLNHLCASGATLIRAATAGRLRILPYDRCDAAV